MGCSSSRQYENNPNLNFNKKDRYKNTDSHAYKVVILGDVYVGKTSIIEKYLNGENITGEYQTTVGIAFSQKIVKL